MKKISDEAYGLLNRQFQDLLRRVDEGTLGLALVRANIQATIQGDRVIQYLPSKREQENLLDIGKFPYNAGYWSVKKHVGRGQVVVERRDGDLYVGYRKVELYLPPILKSTGTVSHYDDVRKAHMLLDEDKLLNANLLEWLFVPENQYLIPESWRGKKVFAWGTIYEKEQGPVQEARRIEFVRYLDYPHARCPGKEWQVKETAAEMMFDNSCLTAVYAD